MAERSEAVRRLLGISLVRYRSGVVKGVLLVDLGEAKRCYKGDRGWCTVPLGTLDLLCIPCCCTEYFGVCLWYRQPKLPSIFIGCSISTGCICSKGSIASINQVGRMRVRLSGRYASKSFPESSWLLSLKSVRRYAKLY